MPGIDKYIVCAAVEMITRLNLRGLKSVMPGWQDLRPHRRRWSSCLVDGTICEPRVMGVWRSS